MRIVLSSAANSDIRRILEYYEVEAGADVAMDFHAELSVVLNRIKRWPMSSTVINDGIRRAILGPRFPYQITYRIVSEDHVRILAVRHHRQGPDLGLAG